MHTAGAVLLVAALVSAAPVRAAGAPDFDGIVVTVAAGDAFTVQTTGGRLRVRLAGVMAPDLRQPFGTRARKQTAALVLGREVRGRVLSHDGEGRAVAVVRAGALDVNAEVVRQGIVWTLPGGSGYSSGLRALEAEARRARRGLWAAGRPEAPWDWRTRMAR